MLTLWKEKYSNTCFSPFLCWAEKVMELWTNPCFHIPARVEIPHSWRLVCYTLQISRKILRGEGSYFSETGICESVFIIIIIIIIGPTALREPWPFSEASASFHPVITSSDFATRDFSRVGLSAPLQSIFMFSEKVYLLKVVQWRKLIFKL
jgi:hypothetical protein